MSKKLLNHLELPHVSLDSDPNPPSGFSRFYTDTEGQLIRKLPDGTTQVVSFENLFSSDEERNAVFTYSEGLLSRIDYISTNYKLFVYSDGNLSNLDYVRQEGTFRKQFFYDNAGNLTGITYLQL